MFVGGRGEKNDVLFPAIKAVEDSRWEVVGGWSLMSHHLEGEITRTDGPHFNFPANLSTDLKSDNTRGCAYRIE